MPNSNLFIHFLHASSAFTSEGAAFPFFMQYIAETNVGGGLKDVEQYQRDKVK